MTALLVLVNILLALIAIALIISVLMQEGERQGLGAITGGAETFFGKNKGKTMEGKLEKITKIAATAFIILAIVSTILTSRVNKTKTAQASTTPVTTVEETQEAETETSEAETEETKTEETSSEG